MRVSLTSPSPFSALQVYWPAWAGVRLCSSSRPGRGPGGSGSARWARRQDTAGAGRPLACQQTSSNIDMEARRGLPTILYSTQIHWTENWLVRLSAALHSRVRLAPARTETRAPAGRTSSIAGASAKQDSTLIVALKEQFFLKTYMNKAV